MYKPNKRTVGYSSYNSILCWIPTVVWVGTCTVTAPL